MTTPPTVPPTQTSDVTSDDRLWVLLCFLFTPLIPIVTLLIEDKKNRSFIKYHNAPTLILGVVETIFITIMAFIPVLGQIAGLVWIYNLVLGIKANRGELTDIPVITEWSKKQGWS